MGNARIGPTAHYTAAVWRMNGLSPRPMATVTGRALYRGLSLIDRVYASSGRQNLEGMLLERHHRIDAVLAAEVSSGKVGQILELAAGLSGRGLRMTERFPGLRYVESDLPAMARRKRAILGRCGGLHEVVPLDASEPHALDRVLSRLSPDRGLIIVTEGLVPYLTRPALMDLWARIAAGLARFPTGLYVTELNLRRDLEGLWAATALELGLRVLVGEKVHLHFRDVEEAQAALRSAGFRASELAPGDAPPGAERPLVRVAVATV